MLSCKCYVSIPFKRESVSKVSCVRYITLYDSVSIPFKRESVSKEEAEANDLKLEIRFQFPSNGKAYPKPTELTAEGVEIVFQFPSNGKAYPKDFLAGEGYIAPDLFQFPSNGKAYPKIRKAASSLLTLSLSFNSLQTGKRIQRHGR